ncbi:hypothetical protein CGLO_14804 [Colletotrichum gloeosporioides Cg-14]|nr:hypothetical protein CGLO_14804 [Colletotrichum gloeosporioides Cg-14]
MLQPEQ